MLDLHVQGLVFSAVEQFGTLVTAARAHRTATAGFFDKYVAPGLYVSEIVRGIQDLTIIELETPAGVPSSTSDIPLVGDAGSAILDPASVETVNVGGLHIPRSAINRAWLLSDESPRPLRVEP